MNTVWLALRIYRRGLSSVGSSGGTRTAGTRFPRRKPSNGQSCRLIFALPLGLPGLIAGPIAYFLGKGSRARIAESGGALGGAGTANAGRILGIITTAVGALVTLLWFVVILNALNDVSFGE